MSIDSVRGHIDNIGKDLMRQADDVLAGQGALAKEQNELSKAGAEFAKATLANQTAHGIAAKLLGNAKQIVQGYLGVA